MKSENVIKRESKRRYDDACAMAHGLDILGERWALLVMRELFWGPRRFTDLRAALPGISANVLTQRLEDLERAGVVSRRRTPPPAPAQLYELTEWGRESEPIFQTLGRWAARSPGHDPTRPLSASSFLLSLRTMLDADRAKAVEGRVGFRLGEETFVATLGDGGIAIAPGSIEGADVVLTGAPPVLAAAIYGGAPLEALEGSGGLRIEGSRRLARKFVTLFPLPEKAPL